MMKNEKRSFKADNSSVSDIVGFVKEKLEEYGVKSKDIQRACIAAEEVSTGIIGHSAEDTINVRMRTLLGTMHIEISSKGEKYDLAETVKLTMLTPRTFLYLRRSATDFNRIELIMFCATALLSSSMS